MGRRLQKCKLPVSRQPQQALAAHSVRVHMCNASCTGLQGGQSRHKLVRTCGVMATCIPGWVNQTNSLAQGHWMQRAGAVHAVRSKRCAHGQPSVYLTAAVLARTAEMSTLTEGPMVLHTYIDFQ